MATLFVVNPTGWWLSAFVLTIGLIVLTGAPRGAIYLCNLQAGKALHSKMAERWIEHNTFLPFTRIQVIRDQIDGFIRLHTNIVEGRGAVPTVIYLGEVCTALTAEEKFIEKKLNPLFEKLEMLIGDVIVDTDVYSACRFLLSELQKNPQKADTLKELLIDLYATIVDFDRRDRVKLCCICRKLRLEPQQAQEWLGWDYACGMDYAYACKWYQP
ncbi:MAG: hypothetical protein NTZ80_00080 [Patescibacteria group bacterium]|nr:hypothetical protein [Patescibacteria group bacterium]